MYTNLPDSIVAKIREEVNKIKEEYQIINPIIRSDIFDILDKLCVVLRYPLDNDEEANGIHVERWIKGKKTDFVFINTSNGIEKQIYTAAHELGHVWKIDEKILSQVEDKADSEAIINRFAAELLMPYDIFSKCFIVKCGEYGIRGGLVEDKPLIKVIVFLMNTFMVPYKATIYRLEEVGFIDAENRAKLEEIEEKNLELIIECIRSGDYQNILKTDFQKSMSDLYNMLDRAEEQELLSDAKLARIREKFEYNKSSIEYEDKEAIAIKNIPEE
jgi:Zn-dependent peptidase ImmA (M78 family)